MTSKPQVGIIGLGRMGLPLARNLLSNGYQVVGHRRGPMDDLASFGGQPASSAAKVADAADIVLTCLPGPDALADVLSGTGGLLGAIGPGHLVIELSTLPLKSKQEGAAAIEARGSIMLDCPLSGVPMMIEKRQVVIFASGDRRTYQSVSGVFDALTDRHIYLGPFGQGSKMKFIANLLVGVHSLAAAEAMALGVRSGFDPSVMVEVIGSSAASSRMFEIRAPMMRDQAYRPAPGPLGSLSRQLHWIHDYCQETAALTPLLDVTLKWFDQAEREGWADADQASLFEMLRSQSKEDT